MLGKEVKLEDAFRYPVTSVPLNLVFPHSAITQNPKQHFRSYLIDVSKACESTLANEAPWIRDTMSVMSAIKVKQTYKEQFKTLMSSLCRIVSH